MNPLNMLATCAAGMHFTWTCHDALPELVVPRVAILCHWHCQAFGTVPHAAAAAAAAPVSCSAIMVLQFQHKFVTVLCLTQQPGTVAVRTITTVLCREQLYLLRGTFKGNYCAPLLTILTDHPSLNTGLE
jgi:hypothetical protein